MDVTRRRFLGGIGLLLCAPTIVRAASLMPVRALPRQNLLNTAQGVPDTTTFTVFFTDAYGRERCEQIVRPTCIADWPQPPLTNQMAFRSMNVRNTMWQYAGG